MSIKTVLSIITKKEHKSVRLVGHRASPSTPHRNAPNRDGTTPERVSRWADRSQNLATEPAQADSGAGGGPHDPDKTAHRTDHRRVRHRIGGRVVCHAMGCSRIGLYTRRSEERREGKAWLRKCRSRGWPYH